MQKDWQKEEEEEERCIAWHGRHSMYSYLVLVTGRGHGEDGGRVGDAARDGHGGAAPDERRAAALPRGGGPGADAEASGTGRAGAHDEDGDGAAAWAWPCPCA